MKKLLLFICLPYILFSQINNSDLEKKEGIIYRKGEKTPFTGKSIAYYETGSKEAILEYQNGVLNGKMENWYPSGKKQVSGKMKNGMKNGLWTAWYENGNIIRRGEYENNLENGIFSWFYKSGKIQKEGIYQEGITNGKWTWYHKNGNKESEGILLNDKNLGKWTWWNENGEIIHQKTFNLVKHEDFPKIRSLLIGQWNFIKTVDSEGKEIKEIKRNENLVKTNAPDITIDSNGTYLKRFTKQNTDNGNWKLVSENEIEFEMIIPKNSQQGNLIILTQQLINKKWRTDSKGNFLDTSKKSIVSIDESEMKIVYEKEYIQIYKKVTK